MKLVARWVLTLSLGCLVSAQTVVDDPVMKARSQRAAAQGIQEDDLPPVPRGVTEPPPLPPPEIHAKDLPRSGPAKAAKGGKVAKGGKAAGRRTAARPGKRAKATAAAPGGKRVRASAPAPRSKATAPANRAGRKAGRKGKA